MDEGVTDDLVALVRRLARSLRKAAPDHDLPSKALDYLARNGLQGSPLRDGDAAHNAEVKRRRRRSHARVLAMAEQPAQSTADKCKLETVPAKGGLLPAQQCVCGEPETLGIHRTDGPSYAEQPAQQEPVATVRTWHKNGDQHAELWNWDRGIESLPDGEHDLYTRPQAPATPLHSEPLTDEEIAKAWSQSKGDIFMRLKPFARAIEAAHGIKEFLK